MLWQSAERVSRHAVSGQVTGTEKEIVAQGERIGFRVRRTNLASEWDQMVLAEAGDINFTNEDHFIMVLLEHSIIDHVCVGRGRD
jgi:hypothetical protein